MYDITEKGEKQYRRVVRLIYGLYILIPLVFLLGCAGLEPTHDCMIVGGDSVNGIEVACPDYRQDPIKHEDHEDYRNNCKDPLSDDCILVA
tara:strand:+ start:770 stop:1042 length:273 start_codon:yes stop_codon:yes gene_type:complete